MSGYVYFHGFWCRQNGGMTADTDLPTPICRGHFTAIAMELSVRPGRASGCLGTGGRSRGKPKAWRTEKTRNVPQQEVGELFVNAVHVGHDSKECVADNLPTSGPR